MTHDELLARIAETERAIARLELRRDLGRLKPAIRQAQAEAEVLEKRLTLNLPNDQPPPRWVPMALLALPVGLVGWLWLLSRLTR